MVTCEVQMTVTLDSEEISTYSLKINKNASEPLELWMWCLIQQQITCILTYYVYNNVLKSTITNTAPWNFLIMEQLVTHH